MARTLLATLLCLPLALASEAAAALELLLADGPLGVPEIVACAGLHLFASVVIAEGLRLRYPAGAQSAATAWRTGLGLSLLLPLYGLVVTAVLILRTPRVTRTKLEDISPSPMEHRKQQAEAELAAEAAKGRAGANVEAIGEALKDTDKAKRLGAVEALRALQNKQAIGLLNKSLRNTVFEVRYHAVEALAGISKKYSERIARATAALEGDPSPANHEALGSIYYEYATLEMEEPSIQLHLYRNALEHLRNAFGPQPGPAVLVRAALCLERLGEADAAWRAYKDVLAVRPESPEALLGVARLQYDRGQFDQLRDTCRRLLDIPDATLDDPTSSVLTLWAEGPQQAPGRTQPPVMR
jgi:tetratricopeptide (TPR) repeat protein